MNDTNKTRIWAEAIIASLIINAVLMGIAFAKVSAATAWMMGGAQ